MELLPGANQASGDNSRFFIWMVGVSIYNTINTDISPHHHIIIDDNIYQNLWRSDNSVTTPQ